MSRYEIKELTRTLIELYCICFTVVFAATCAVLLAIKIYS